MQTPALASSQPQEVFTKEGCGFLNQSTAAVDVLVNALYRGKENLENEDPAPPSLYNRVKQFLYPPKPTDLDILKKIHVMWIVCIASLHQQRGDMLHQSLKCLVKERKEHANEFHMLVPGLADKDLKTAFFHLYAIGSLFKTFAASAEVPVNVNRIRRFINQAVYYFHQAGIPKDDASLKNYQQVFLDTLLLLEKAKSESSNSFTSTSKAA